MALKSKKKRKQSHNELIINVSQSYQCMSGFSKREKMKLKFNINYQHYLPLIYLLQ